MSDTPKKPETDATPAPAVPRGLVCAVLAILWIFPSIGAVMILLANKGSFRPGTVGDVLGSVRLEQWLAIVLLAVHAVFIYGAFVGSGFALLRKGMSGRRINQ